MLWLLETKKDFLYDSYDGFVIRAPTEQAARELAQSKIADEKLYDKQFWLKSQFSECDLLPDEGNTEIVLSSFNAG